MNPLTQLTLWQECLQLLMQVLPIVCGMMALLWVIQLLLRNAAVMQVGWSIGLVFCAGWYAFFGSGAFPRRWLLALLVGIWGLRLALHLLLNRVGGQTEDGRYAEVRQKWGASSQWKLFLLFQAVAVSCVVLSIPFLIACLNSDSDFNRVEKGAVLLWLIATSGVTIADMQLNRFRSKPENQGQVCREGLWSWSRHPNYFFEWLVWLSFGLFALTAPFGAIGMIAPALMLYLLLHLTGIPRAEEQALRSRGDAYRQYQQEVSELLPLPPKDSRRELA
ncbi:DUF1295 domain-containing protein [Bryobacter aggregatus]|uniref:DUF1295 domain-containing protein n=1 Tax=Bryobacter aggregatus TaxID=360054 RepID=UPI00056A9C82|nr:DUF1295 domain-containing protein [Bryobacter aggregatus]